MVSRTFSSRASRRAPSIESHRSGAVSRSGRAASGRCVASTNRRSACSCAGSTSFAGTGTTTTWRKAASGHGSRSSNPVSSRPSRKATATGSCSPGSPWPPTCIQACCRSCQRSSTRWTGGGRPAPTPSRGARHGDPTVNRPPPTGRTRRTSPASDTRGRVHVQPFTQRAIAVQTCHHPPAWRPRVFTGVAWAGPLRHRPAGRAPGGDAVGVRAPVPADRRAMATDR